MNGFASIVVASAAMVFSTITHAQDARAVPDAKAAANTWLAVSDQGDQGATWELAAPEVQAKVQKSAWIASISAVRSPLGAVKSRQVRFAVYTTDLSSAPDGEYVVIQYDTQFEHKANAVETVIPMREKDGSWKVSGYQVR